MKRVQEYRSRRRMILRMKRIRKKRGQLKFKRNLKKRVRRTLLMVLRRLWILLTILKITKLNRCKANSSQTSSKSTNSNPKSTISKPKTQNTPKISPKPLQILNPPTKNSQNLHPSTQPSFPKSKISPPPSNSALTPLKPKKKNSAFSRSRTLCSDKSKISKVKTPNLESFPTRNIKCWLSLWLNWRNWRLARRGWNLTWWRSRILTIWIWRRSSWRIRWRKIQKGKSRSKQIVLRR